MDVYNLIADEIQNRLNRNEITLEQANEINDLAYNKYVIETDLEAEQRKADLALLNQYKKELSDLEHGTGLAKTMSRREIEYAKNRLKESIRGFKGYLY